MNIKTEITQRRPTQVRKIVVDTSRSESQYDGQIEFECRIKANRTSLGKRALDYLITIPAVVLLLPVFALVFIAVKLTDPEGSAIFVQKREGLFGSQFPFFKFRTMYSDADARLDTYLSRHPERKKEWEEIYKLEDDPRVLPFIGNFMRKSSLDELPNLFNILRGEMSLVGPRPFPSYHLDRFDDTFRHKRASVRPGLTGLWQINRGDLDAQKYWDEAYINNWSLAGDIKIFLKTVPVILFVRKPHF